MLRPVTGSAPASAVAALFRSRGASSPARYSRNPASPASSKVIELSAADGRVLASRTVPGTAYGVAAAGKTLHLTLARKSAVAKLDADTSRPW